MSAKSELKKIVKRIQFNITDDQLNALVNNIFNFHQKFINDFIKGTSKDKKEPIGIINYFRNKENKK